MTVEQVARALHRQHGIPMDAARTAARRNAVAQASLAAGGEARRVLRSEEVLAIALGTFVSGRRLGDRLELMIDGPPRTKKNGTMLGIKQTPAYRRYRDAMIKALAPLHVKLELPLPEGEYNIAATYYVDRRGERADKVGLDQGLYDALENAGVVTNDWQFRTADGTRIVFGDPRPRVELTISPLESNVSASD